MTDGDNLKTYSIIEKRVSTFDPDENDESKENMNMNLRPSLEFLRLT